MCRRFAAEGAEAVIVSDIDEAGAAQVAEEIGGTAARTDVAVEADIKALVDKTQAEYGRIDLFCSNAGIICGGGVEVPDEKWQEIWGINVMGHIHAARAVLPDMIRRGEGYLLNTASAAGLLSQIGSAPYSVTKHAAVAFAEWLWITYREQGVRVSCLCPQGVRTNMLVDRGPGAMLSVGSVSPEEVAECVVQGLSDEKFLILPHPEVEKYLQNKANDYERWLRGMQRLHQKFCMPG